MGEVFPLDWKKISFKNQKGTKETKVCQIPVIGSLSNDEGGGCENVT